MNRSPEPSQTIRDVDEDAARFDPDRFWVENPTLVERQS